MKKFEKLVLQKDLCAFLRYSMNSLIFKFQISLTSYNLEVDVQFAW